MNAYADKTQKNKYQSVANAVSKKQSSGESVFQFVDNRPEAITQKKLQEMANNSPQVMQLRAFQELTKSIPQTKETIQLQPFDEGRPIGGDGITKEFRSTTPGGAGGQYYFRAVTQKEYDELVTTGSFTRTQSYQGISPTEDYAAQTIYFGANKSHHLIEFKVVDGIDLVQEFKYAGTSQKTESGVMSMGVGTKATPVQAGQPADGGEYFMHCLRARCISWRLIRFIGRRPPDVYRG